MYTNSGERQGSKNAATQIIEENLDHLHCFLTLICCWEVFLQSKECLMHFLWELDTLLMKLHVTFLCVTSERWNSATFFQGNNMGEKKYVAPLEGGLFEIYGFERLSYSTDIKYSAHASTCKGALVNI